MLQRGERAKSASPLHQQLVRVIEVVVAQLVGCPIGERQQRSGRVRAGVLRIERRARDHHVRRVPHLTVLVGDRIAGIAAHNRAARTVRALILMHVVGVERFSQSRCGRDSSLCDVVTTLRQKLVHVVLVFVKVEGHPQERLSQASL